MQQISLFVAKHEIDRERASAKNQGTLQVFKSGPVRFYRGGEGWRRLQIIIPNLYADRQEVSM